MANLSSLSLMTAALLFASPLCAAYQQEPLPNPSDIRVVPVDPTPEGDEVRTKIIFPEDGDFEKSNPVKVQIRLDGFPLRTFSQFPRSREVLNYNKEGQSLHVIIDDRPYFIENEAQISALEDQDVYYKQVLEFDIPFKLKPGQHTMRVFPARSYGESLKGDGCFAVREFFVNSKTPLSGVDLNKPYLTYNQPQEDCNYEKNKPILLDFYISNTQLSPDGYKVRLTIDNTVQRTIVKWTPYYVYGLKAGTHTFKLELLNETNKVVPGPFNTVERSFCIRN